MLAGHIVEHGPSIEIYHHAAHPYTKGLLASVPRLDEPRKMRLQPIEGQPPDLIQAPKGCAFAPRCSQAHEACHKGRPPMIEIAPEHFAACRLATPAKKKIK